jgi:arylsulfatase A-like enzyme/Flp pilus assembly protein TadD
VNLRPALRAAMAGLIASAGLIGGSLTGCSAGRRGQVQADLHPIARQNVLLVTIDTLRADALGSYGGRAATPALDRLAAEGVRFDFAHAHAVVTLTSHASILTGLYPFQHGLRDNSGYRLDPGMRTAASLFKDAGYATAAFVAAFPLHSRFGLATGFDRYDETFGETRAPTEFVMPERPASAVVPLARQWINDRAHAAQDVPRTTEPWFVWLHLFDPHAPYRPPPPFDAQYRDQPYLGEVAATDFALAPLLDDLRAGARPTFVVVTGDHGEALGDHGEQSHGLFAYESTLHIPLIIAELDTSGRATAGEVSSVPARHIDILPTMLDAAGLAVPDDLPGRTLVPASERGSAAPPRSSYFEAMSGMLNRGWAPLSGVLAGRDKLIDLPIRERYDLAADSAEQVNLAGREPERDRALLARLRDFKAPAPGARVAEDADASARLRALGYVSAGTGLTRATFTDADDPKRLVALDEEIHRAVEAFGAGRAAEAVEIYRNVIDRRPDMAIAYRHLAFLEARQGDTASAIDVLQRAVRAGVTDRRVLTLLGEYLAQSGRVEAGIRLLEPLAHDVQVDADTLNTLGIAYAQAHRANDARQTFERVITINPRSSVPLENLGMLSLERGDLAAARTYFDRAVSVDVRSSRAHAGLGVVASRAGDRAGAVEEWETAVRLDPANFEALYNLGTTLARAGELAAARPYLERFVQTAPPAFDKDKREVARLLTSASAR